MAAVLALCAAGLYGTSDFCGGLASRGTDVVRVMLVSTPVGLLALLLLAMWTELPDGEALLVGAAAGAFATVGALLLYRALAAGPMNVVAPASAAIAAALPVVAGLIVGERPGILALLGVGLALAAIVAVSTTSGPGSGAPVWAGLLLAVGAGCGFGLFFLLLFPIRADGLWPLVASRCSMVLIVGVVAVGTRRLTPPPRSVWPLGVGMGLAEVSAHLLYLQALDGGLLALVAVLTSLYPVSTVLLARVVLHERFGAGQLGGLVLAVGAATLIALSS